MVWYSQKSCCMVLSAAVCLSAALPQALGNTLASVTVKVHRRLGGLSSGIPSAPRRLTFMVMRPLMGAWGLLSIVLPLCKKSSVPEQSLSVHLSA